MVFRSPIAELQENPPPKSIDSIVEFTEDLIYNEALVRAFPYKQEVRIKVFTAADYEYRAVAYRPEGSGAGWTARITSDTPRERIIPSKEELAAEPEPLTGVWAIEAAGETPTDAFENLRQAIEQWHAEQSPGAGHAG